MFIHSNIQKLLYEVDFYNRGIDHLTLNLKEPIIFLKKILLKLDLDNSNIAFKQIGEYGITFTKSRSQYGDFLNITISIENIAYTIFQYMQYNEKNKAFLKSEGSFSFYSTYFRLLETQKLPYTFEMRFFGKGFGTVLKSFISRMDYKVDFFYKNQKEMFSKDTILKGREGVKNEEYFGDADEILHNKKILKTLLKHLHIERNFLKGRIKTGRNYGSKRNKSIFVRAYEKIIDSMIKGKRTLYEDYFIYANVFRLECEFRTKFNKKEENGQAKSYIYSELSELELKAQEYMGLVEIDTNKKYIYQYSEDSQVLDNIKYFKDFGGRGFKLALSGQNPFIILHKQLKRKAIEKQIKQELLDTLILEYQTFLSFNQEKLQGTKLKTKQGNNS